MEQNDLDRLEKIELRAREIYKEIFGLEVPEVYFDILNDYKMLEILAYGFPTGISWWASGRNYERLRTIHDNVDANTPLEVVLFADPYRAYLMQSNTFAVQVLVLVHVLAHCLVFENNKWFKNTRRDLTQVISQATHRFNKYEEIYGIDEVEATIDAGKSLQFHSSPFDTETESEKKKRVYENQKRQIRSANKSEYHDIGTKDPDSSAVDPIDDVEQYNYQLWRTIQRHTPVEPTEDILRFVIDNSKYLEDWQKDILEVLRMEGQYYWPMMKTKYLHEGFATYCHEKVINQLVKEGYLTAMEHGQYNYSNSLVKAQHRMALNPYLIGSEILKSVEDRWNKGQFGSEYDNCTDYQKKLDWDTKAGKGIEKVKEVMVSYTDWMLVQDFLTDDLIDKLDLYIYVEQENSDEIQYVRTGHTAKEIRQLIIACFSNSNAPKIEVVNGNFRDRGYLFLKHVYSGIQLDTKYAEETIKHLCGLWSNDVILATEFEGKKVQLRVKNSEHPDSGSEEY